LTFRCLAAKDNGKESFLDEAREIAQSCLREASEGTKRVG
jgi:hypothetical protein